MLAVFATDLAMAQTFTYPTKGKDGYTLTQKRMDGVNISYNMSQFTLSSINYRGEEMSEIGMTAIALPNVAGCPNLPADSRLMAIPQGAKATLKSSAARRKSLKVSTLLLLCASKPSLRSLT